MTWQTEEEQLSDESENDDLLEEDSPSEEPILHRGDSGPSDAAARDLRASGEEDEAASAI